MPPRHQCPTCKRSASSGCWTTHLGWCPTHQTAFPFEESANGIDAGPACSTCLNIEYQATETYSRAQADSMALTQELERTKVDLEWRKRTPERFEPSSAAELLLAVEALEGKIAKSEVRRRAAYGVLTQATAARRASQARYRG